MAKKTLSPTAEKLLEQLRAAEKETGDKIYSKLAGQLEASCRAKGRREIDDANAIHKMGQLLREGKVSSQWAAAMQVAAEIKGQSTESTAKRLNRKYSRYLSLTSQPKPCQALPAPRAPTSSIGSFELQQLLQTIVGSPWTGDAHAFGAFAHSRELWREMREQHEASEGAIRARQLMFELDEALRRSGLRETMATFGAEMEKSGLTKMFGQFEEARRSALFSPEIAELLKLADSLKSRR